MIFDMCLLISVHPGHIALTNTCCSHVLTVRFVF